MIVRCSVDIDYFPFFFLAEDFLAARGFAARVPADFPAALRALVVRPGADFAVPRFDAA